MIFLLRSQIMQLFPFPGSDDSDSRIRLIRAIKRPYLKIFIKSNL